MSDEKEVITIRTGYFPRPLQEKLHASLRRFNVIVCHRRFGKTIFSLNEMTDKALRNPLKDPQYAYIAPNYGQAKRVAWEALKGIVKNIPGISVHEQELRIDVPRGEPFNDRVRLMLLGAETPGSIRGIYLDGAILDEFAECDPVIWSQVVRPALSDRLGWAIFIGTPKGQNHFADVLQVAKKSADHWYWAIYRASETGIIDKSELALAALEMSEEEYNQEFECSFTAALTGAYYGKLLEDAEKTGRIRNVPYDPACLVSTYWDLGVGDTTAIWFIQQVGHAFHAIDYYETSGAGLDHYAKLLQQKQYAYQEHVLPHDAAARSLESGRARVQILNELGVYPTRVLPREAPADGIQACRTLLPRVYFDQVKCERGITALKNYQRKWDSKNKTFSNEPLHNWASNGADAFRAFGVGCRDESRRPRHQDLPRVSDSAYDIFGDND
jgi:phage terminase large subunit